MKSHRFAGLGWALFVGVCLCWWASGGCTRQSKGKRVYAATRTLKVDGKSFDKEVLKAEGPVLVDFWAIGCKPCQMMAPALESLAQDYKVCKVDIDENPELKAAYGVSSIPTVLIFKEGKMVDRHVGVTEERELR